MENLGMTITIILAVPLAIGLVICFLRWILRLDEIVRLLKTIGHELEKTNSRLDGAEIERD